MRTRNQLKQMQSLPLEAKINATKLRIREYYESLNGDVYVSFSGGKDSTVLLDIARSIYPDIKAVYCDTGLEYPELKSYVKKQKNITIIRPKLSFKEIITRYGYPVASKEISRKIYYAKRGSKWAQKFVNGYNYNGTKSKYCISKRWLSLIEAPFDVSDKCCFKMKKEPFAIYERKEKLHPILATMASESTLREQAWLRTGCNSFDGHIMSKPMSFWTDQDVLEYIYKNNIQICSVYGDILFDGSEYKLTGLKRTGCMFCLYGIHLEKSPNRIEKLKETHPSIYDYILRDDGLGLQKVMDYCNLKY